MLWSIRQLCGNEIPMILGLLGIVIGITGIFVGWCIASYYAKKTASQKGQNEIRGMVKEILNIVIKDSGRWYEANIETAVPPIAKAAMLVFSSKNGHVKGYVRAKGKAEKHPFDTDINNQIPIGLRVEGPWIEFQTIGVPDGTELTIKCAGSLLNLPAQNLLSE